MSYSDTVSMTTFQVNDIIDHSFSRCRMVSQQITGEMQKIARDELYLMLSSLANTKIPSWCIEKMTLDLYMLDNIVKLPTGTVEVMNVLYLDSNTNTQVPLTPVNRDIFANQFNHMITGRPTNYWFQRNTSTPVLNIWPTPNEAASMNKLVVWRHRHIMDVGTLQNTLEVPQRWLDAIIFGLASRLALRFKEVDLNLIPILESKASSSLASAWEGDNDGSSTFYQPNISAYTR